MLTARELESRLLRFTREKLARDEMASLIDADTRLFEDRVIDSLRILELIAFLQSALGRKIPDAQIVLANFRSIATIARVFTSDEPVMIRAGRRARSGTSGHRSPGGQLGTVTRVARPTSPVDELLARGEMVLTRDGSLRLHGALASLRDSLDRTVREWAIELGAIEKKFPDEIPLPTLERAGFIRAFPDKVVRVGGEARPPAVCYHHYPQFADGIVDCCGSLVTAVGHCYRNEFDESSSHPIERLRAFTMREIVAIGKDQFVEGLRSDLMERVTRWTKDLGLDAFIETATDPFFTRESRGRKLMQQMLPLKYELRLRVDADGRTVAAASFNNHHDHFGKAFSINLASGAFACSGCVAFGWERWLIAIVNQHGPDERNWPDQVRSRDVALL